MVRKCTCKNEYQDKKYGKGMRVHNPTLGGRGSTKGGWRCSVCEATKAGAEPKAAKGTKAAPVKTKKRK